MLKMLPVPLPRWFWAGVFPVVVLAAAYWFIASPILASPYWGDDIGDSQFPMRAALDHTSYLPWVWDQTREWSRTTGRFFPLNIANASAVYLLFTDRESYKIYQFVVLAITLALFAVLQGVLFRSRWAAYLGFGLALLTLQFKCWYDPYWQFAGQQELWVSLALVALIGAVVAVRASSQRWRRIAFGGGLIGFVGAALTYESSIFLVSIIPLLLMRERSPLAIRARVAMGYFAAAALLLTNLFWQRSQAVVNNSGYTISLAPRLVAKTLKNQMEGAIPLSYRHLQGHSIFPGTPTLPASVVVCVLICGLFLIVMLMAAFGFLRSRHHGLKWLVLAGLSFWGFPSLFVAISARWQVEVQPGMAYLPVLSGGLALMMLVLCVIGACRIALTRPTRALPPWSTPNWQHLALSLVIAFGSTGLLVVQTVASRDAIQCGTFQILQLRRDAFAQAVQQGLLSGDVPKNAVIVRPVVDWWEWQNTAFAAWYGAPDTIRFVRPEDLGTVDCGGTDPCYQIVEENPSPGVITYRLVPLGTA